MTTTGAELSIKAVDETEAHEGGKNNDEGRGRFRLSRIPIHVLLIIFSILMFIPFMWMVFSAFKPLDEIFMRPPVMLPTNWTLDGFKTAWEGAPFGTAYFNSFYIVTGLQLLAQKRWVHYTE
jgi:multiple sugar transport system permease protein